MTSGPRAQRPRTATAGGGPRSRGEIGAATRLAVIGGLIGVVVGAAVGFGVLVHHLFLPVVVTLLGAGAGAAVGAWAGQPREPAPAERGRGARSDGASRAERGRQGEAGEGAGKGKTAPEGAGGEESARGGGPVAAARSAAATIRRSAEPDLVPAGWYPDPRGEAPYRYWDGHGWSTQIRASAAEDGTGAPSQR